MAKRITGPAVKAGSVWTDNIRTGRSIQVERIEHDYAVCKTLTNSREVQRLLDVAPQGGFGLNTRDMRGSIARIRLNRFRPVANGFTHFTDTPSITDDALIALLDAA
jgi:hypothetical protein